MAEKLRVRLKSTTAQPLSATIPVPAIVQGGANIHVSDTPKVNGRDAFSTGGAYILQQQINGKANIEDIPAMPEIPTVPTKLSELENDCGFVSAEDVDNAINQKGFVTETDLNNKGFLTDEDIEGLATEQYVTGIVGDINQVLDMINGEVI